MYATKEQTATVRLVMDVTYTLNGERPDMLALMLGSVVDHAVNYGLLTSCTNASADDVRFTTSAVL